MSGSLSYLVFLNFECELHAHLFEVRVGGDNHPFDERKLISGVRIGVQILYPLVNEDLVGLLLSFDQVFATDHS